MSSFRASWLSLNPAIKLAIGYVGIIMLISLFFSAVLYSLAATQLENSLRQQYGRINQIPRSVLNQRQLAITPAAQIKEELETGKQNLFLQLLYFNLIIFALSSAASYLLAKRNLRPIEDALAAQKRFSADASHELRTPLAAMQAEIEVALRDKKLTTSQARDLLNSNLEEVNRIRHMTDSLLQLARSDSNDRVELKKRKTKIEKVITLATKKVKTSAKAKKISLSVEVKNETAKINQDSIVDILVILLDNAIKYSNDKSKVILRVKQRAKTTYLSVIDEGEGIAKEDLDHIFERFYRSSSSRSKTETNGFGLGLSIASELARQNNATIRVKSAKDKGSVFTVVIFPD